MSHELEKIGDMVYVGKKPWHDMGEELQSIEELPKCLDWQVKKLPMFFYPNGDNTTVNCGDFRALIRSDNDTMLGVVTDQYQPHQNYETWKVFSDFARAGDMTLETAGVLKGGRTIWALAKLNKSFEAKPGDRQELYALLSNNHEGKRADLIKACATRVVCWNTLSLAESEKRAQYSQTHRSAFDPKRAQEFVAQAILGFEDYEHKVAELNSLTFNGFNRAISEAFVAELLAPQILEKAIAETKVTYADIKSKRSFIDEIILRDDSCAIFTRTIENEANRPVKLALHDVAVEQAGVAGKTPWSLVNGITRYIDHTYGHNADNRLNNAWFGQGDNLKSRALDLAVEYTQALNH